MSTAEPRTQSRLSRRQKRILKKELKATHRPRVVVRALLRVADVILDSASGIPGLGVFKELKDGTGTLLDDVQDLEQEIR